MPEGITAKTPAMARTHHKLIMEQLDKLTGEQPLLHSHCLFPWGDAALNSLPIVAG